MKVFAFLTGILTITFVVLRLTDVIEWHWAWVLAPLWIGVILALIAGILQYMLWRKATKHILNMQSNMIKRHKRHFGRF